MVGWICRTHTVTGVPLGHRRRGDGTEVRLTRQNRVSAFPMEDGNQEDQILGSCALRHSRYSLPIQPRNWNFTKGLRSANEPDHFPAPPRLPGLPTTPRIHPSGFRLRPEDRPERRRGYIRMSAFLQAASCSQARHRTPKKPHLACAAARGQTV